MNNRKKMIGKAVELLLPLLVLLMGVIAMYMVTPTVSQAAAPVPLPQKFLGEYSYDGTVWMPLETAESLSALDGDLYLRGHWQNEIPAQCRINYYSDHIGNEIFVNGELHDMDITMELYQHGIVLQPSMCSRGWGYWYFPEAVPADALIEIHLRNPHQLANRGAYRLFLSSIICTPDNPEFLAGVLAPFGNPGVVLGGILILFAVLLLGSAAASVMLRISIGLEIANVGLLMAFTGGFFLFDTVHISLLSDNKVLNSYGWQVCMMYAVFWIGVLVKNTLGAQARRVAEPALWVSSIVNAVLLLLAFTNTVLIYDMLPLWAAVQLMLCPVLIGCCIQTLICEAPEGKAKLYLLCVLLLSVMVDILGRYQSVYSSAILSKTVLLVFLLYLFFRFSRKMLVDHKASIRAQMLERELEESRISIMLSQIQPHFLFNVLGTLRGLCREDPEQAWKGLGDFSSYLRGNMNSLTQSAFIPFETELRHVETYLRLEKMRLGEKLSIVYEIDDKDFQVPPLTLQPLVENAIKHGIFHKAGGGTITICSRREKNRIIISVRDDGVGFETEKPEPVLENQIHVGLDNVRKRTEKMLGGTLRVDSAKGCGTTVTLEFPVENHGTKGV